MNKNDWQKRVTKYIEAKEYGLAADLYEQIINEEPEVKSHYGYLGLMLLLQGKETEAQSTWFFPIVTSEPEEIESWNRELIVILKQEAERLAKLEDYEWEWVVRQHIKEFDSTDVNNQLSIILLSVWLKNLKPEDFDTSKIVELLATKKQEIDYQLLLSVLANVLEYENNYLIIHQFAEACLNSVDDPHQLIDVIMLNSIKTAHSKQKPKLGSMLAEICLKRSPNNLEVLRHLVMFYQNAYEYQQGIETAKLCYELSQDLADKIHANHLVIRSFMSASGYWQEACEKLAYQESLIQLLAAESPAELESNTSMRLFNSAFFFPYIRDNAQVNRNMQNQIAQICYQNVHSYGKDLIEKCNYKTRKKSTDNKKILKIGYISHCLRNHSVGWISRWLFKYHDREKFQIHTYMNATASISDFTQTWFINNSHKAYRFELPTPAVIERVYEDDIDILVDLDSITLDFQSEVLSVKPAPIQVSWLGWDATGLPSVDYFIADPYVLPENAQDYYQEKIWRLPQTYLAVGGFEVGVPTLSRETLNIPEDAIIYFVAQRGYKRHLDNVKLQMQIIKEVPNSYLLVKGVADQDSSQMFYEQIATEVGVKSDRLRFLDLDNSEPEHRANLAVADVVLDTYPYNGATTTLETLWVGVPLVTKVGQQFSARNSYGMMMNVGVTEGIAWTDEEYLAWGIKFGKDENLRREVAWKLRQSRKNAPLWDAKKFTREMEKAYQQMWEKYVNN